ncbi:unnamed protein product, partial [Phaeothamnion confervicola]
MTNAHKALAAKELMAAFEAKFGTGQEEGEEPHQSQAQSKRQKTGGGPPVGRLEQRRQQRVE